MAVYTINISDSGYVESSLKAPIKNYDADYQEAVLAAPLLIYGPPKTKYEMSGFDSNDGSKVYWTSYDTPNETPTVTTPALVGTLEFPHVINETIV